LCYADLRPVPVAAVPAPRHVASDDAQTASSGALQEPSLDPLTAPMSTLLEHPAEPNAAPVPAPAPEPADAEVAEQLPGVVDPVLGSASWPCSVCGAHVPLLLDACSGCGAGFLTGAIPPTTMSVPIVGDVSRLSKAQRFGLAAGLAIAIVVLFLVLATVLGAVL
jgi:hypothetical protein